ncbi:MAG: hypothetical protein KKH92_05940 [Firmicutes bacterium]|nr:hypothetical protein [Bacillota bacterium]
MKKKIAIVLLLLSSFMMFGSFGSIDQVDAATANRTLTSQFNHILADVNEVLDTRTIKVKGAFGEIFLNEATLASANPSVTITANSISVSEKGVFPIGFSYQSNNMTLYLISKLEAETEYVIYEQDFTGVASGAIPSSLNLFNNLGAAGGSAAIDNERLFLSPYTIVLFPTYLSGFSNYIIETDMRMASASNASRWTSVLFRYTTENYFQMAIRQDATAANGVEFAKRVSGNWNVPMTAPYTEQLAPGTFYNLKVDVNNTTVKEYINDTEIMTYENAFEYTHGRIGVQADNVNVYYDNIKITLPVDYIEEEKYQFASVVEVYNPETGIVNPATTLVWFNDITQLDDFSETIRPATAIFRINSDLNVVNESGAVLLSLEDALIGVDGRVIPAFYTNDVAVAEALATELKDLRIYDLFLISDSADAILAARAVHGVIRGVLNHDLDDVTSLSDDDLMDLRRLTNRAQAVASIIPSRLLNQDQVLYMQQRAMTVWVSTGDDDVSQYRAILSGANGILSNDYEGIFEKYALFTETTHVRRPLMIAHRGLYAGGLSSAPENTIEAAQEAYLRGADILELDVHLTLDLEIVIMHDNTTARTAPAHDSLTIVNSFLADLKALNLADPIGGRTDLKMPTLREYFEEFKGKNVVIYIEIKPTMPLLVKMVGELIEEMDMYSQSAIITFASQNILTMNDEYADVSNGLLTGAVLNAQSVNTSLTNTFSTIVPINSTLNPSFGALTKDYIEAITHRGITVWPWTLNEYPTMTQYYNYGIGGMTTDHIGYFENTFNRLVLSNHILTAFVEDALDLQVTAQIETPNGTTYPYMPTYVVIDDGGTGITLDASGNVLTATNPGSFYAYTTFTSTLPDGTAFAMTSDLLEITLSNPPVIPEEPEVPVEEGNNALLIVIAAVGGSAALGAAGFFGFKFYKSRKIIQG